MNRPRISVVIPYKQRLQNVRLAFEGLARQTLPRDDFEVVVGAMEYCPDFLALCREFADRLNLISVMSGAEFEIPRARNLGMRQARGEVCVQMDADTLLPPAALEGLYDRHFRFGQDVCVVGQVVGYGNNTEGDVGEVPARPYEAYADGFADLARGPPQDPRFQRPHIVPWAFAWTGLIALRLDTVRRHDLYFDEDFRGWGVDDLEWSLRICEAGVPIVLRPDLYALHLPHARDAGANHRASRRNFRRLLRKWPRADVELTAAFDDFVGNDSYLTFTREAAAAAGSGATGLGSAHGAIAGRPALIVGVPLDAANRVLDPEVLSRFDPGVAPEVLPLAGLALPFADQTFGRAHVLPAVGQLSERFREAIAAELKRVAQHVSADALTGVPG